MNHSGALLNEATDLVPYFSADDTASLTTSIFNYRWENGRRYHAFRDGEYW
jgi:hypothetical protein